MPIAPAYADPRGYDGRPTGSGGAEGEDSSPPEPSLTWLWDPRNAPEILQGTALPPLPRVTSG
jgi:hypothetical protein